MATITSSHIELYIQLYIHCLTSGIYFVLLEKIFLALQTKAREQGIKVTWIGVFDYDVNGLMNFKHLDKMLGVGGNVWFPMIGNSSAGSPIMTQRKSPERLNLSGDDEDNVDDFVKM